MNSRAEPGRRSAVSVVREATTRAPATTATTRAPTTTRRRHDDDRAGAGHDGHASAHRRADRADRPARHDAGHPEPDLRAGRVGPARIARGPHDRDRPRPRRRQLRAHHRDQPAGVHRHADPRVRHHRHADRRRVHRGGVHARRRAAAAGRAAGGRGERRDDAHHQRRLGPVHRPAGRDRQRRARRRRDLDPRRRRPGERPRLPRADARRS